MEQTVLKIGGHVGERNGDPVPFAKVIVVGSDGKPAPFNGKNVGATTNDQGQFTLDVPILKTMNGSSPLGSHLIVRSTGNTDQLMPLSPSETQYDFIIGKGAYQEEEAVYVTACKSTKCKLKKTFKENKNLLIAAVVSFVVFAVVISVVAATHKSKA